MGVVDFYASREAGSKERVSLFFFPFCSTYHMGSVNNSWFFTVRPLVQQANVYLGSRNGSGNAGSTLMVFISTGPDEITWNTKWELSRLTMRETTF